MGLKQLCSSSDGYPPNSPLRAVHRQSAHSQRICRTLEGRKANSSLSISYSLPLVICYFCSIECCTDSWFLADSNRVPLV